MPEPNLPPLRLSFEGQNDKNLISIPNIKEKLPELPEMARKRLLDNFNLATIHAINLVVRKFN